MLRINHYDLSVFITQEQWGKNQTDITWLKESLSQHKVFSNPCIEFFRNNAIPLPVIQAIHLDYRIAIVQIFTDALLAAAYQAKQLEENFSMPAGIKMIPRFLLTPNLQDEFGFHINNNQLSGSPLHAHYPLFESVLKSLGLSSQDISRYIPSESAQALRFFLQGQYHDFINITVLLAAVELQVVVFSPILRSMLDQHGIDTSSDYYLVHGASTETETLGCDDEHADDLWRCACLAINFTSLDSVQLLLTHYLDHWDTFWTDQFQRVSHTSLSAENLLNNTALHNASLKT